MASHRNLLLPYLLWPGSFHHASYLQMKQIPYSDPEIHMVRLKFKNCFKLINSNNNQRQETNFGKPSVFTLEISLWKCLDHEATAMIKAQFMQMWDGLETTNDIVVVMGATNRSAHISFYLLTGRADMVDAPRDQKTFSLYKTLNFLFPPRVQRAIYALGSIFQVSFAMLTHLLAPQIDDF